MDKFEDFIVQKYPNRSAKVLLHKLQDNDGIWFYVVKEVQDQSEAWQSRQAEVDQLKEAIQRQGKLAIQAMNEAHKGSRLELSIAKDIQASLKPELIESERQMNAQLTDENMKLEAEVDALKNLLEKDEYAHNLYYENANLQTLVEEKDKRITELEKSEFELAKVKQILNKHIKTRLLESIIVRELIDLLFSNKG